MIFSTRGHDTFSFASMDFHQWLDSYHEQIYLRGFRFPLSDTTHRKPHAVLFVMRSYILRKESFTEARGKINHSRIHHENDTSCGVFCDERVSIERRLHVSVGCVHSDVKIHERIGGV